MRAKRAGRPRDRPATNVDSRAAPGWLMVPTPISPIPGLTAPIRPIPADLPPRLMSTRWPQQGHTSGWLLKSPPCNRARSGKGTNGLTEPFGIWWLCWSRAGPQRPPRARSVDPQPAADPAAVLDLGDTVSRQHGRVGDVGPALFPKPDVGNEGVGDGLLDRILPRLAAEETEGDAGHSDGWWGASPGRARAREEGTSIGKPVEWMRSWERSPIGKGKTVPERDGRGKQPPRNVRGIKRLKKRDELSAVSNLKCNRGSKNEPRKLV